jgi:dTDP-4-amino-4,6-dideoxygalactose transaminase
VPFAWPGVGPDEIDLVSASISSGWLGSGAQVKDFESAVAAYIGGDVHAVATSSCSIALLIALRALGIGSGDEVITTTNTFSATAMAIVHAGAEPVLVDIDATTLNIDPKNVEAAITSKTKAIIPVHGYRGLDWLGAT